MFAFGILTKRKPKDNLVIWVSLLSPLVILGIDLINNAAWFTDRLDLSPEAAKSLINLSDSIFNGFKIGIEILILNGMLTFAGLWMISRKNDEA